MYFFFALLSPLRTHRAAVRVCDVVDGQHCWCFCHHFYRHCRQRLLSQLNLCQFIRVALSVLVYASFLLLLLLCMRVCAFIFASRIIKYRLVKCLFLFDFVFIFNLNVCSESLCCSRRYIQYTRTHTIYIIAWLWNFKIQQRTKMKAKSSASACTGEWTLPIWNVHTSTSWSLTSLERNGDEADAPTHRNRA